MPEQDSLFDVAAAATVHGAAAAESLPKHSPFRAAFLAGILASWMAGPGEKPNKAQQAAAERAATAALEDVGL